MSQTSTGLELFDLPQGWASLLQEEQRRRFEGSVLPSFLRRQRWFGGKGEPIESVRVQASAELSHAGRHWWLPMVEVRAGGRPPASYFLPLALTFEEPRDLSACIALARIDDRQGVIEDALVDPDFARAVVAALQRLVEQPAGSGRFRYSGTRALGRARLPDVVRPMGVEQSNTSVILDDSAVMKIYRRLHPGVQPDIEVTRFLLEHGFLHTPALLGTLEYVDAAGEPTAVGLLQAYTPNDGDGWSCAQAHLDGMLSGHAAAAPSSGDIWCEPRNQTWLRLCRMIGLRTGEMHFAFASADAHEEAFSPQPVGAEELERWAADCREQFVLASESLRRRRKDLPTELRAQVDELLGLGDLLERRIGELVPASVHIVSTRLHGDFHLGQVLVQDDDVMLIDFEGEPARELIQRRQKTSPLKDVAGMLRSFNYAAWSSLLRCSGQAGAEELSAVVKEWEQRSGSAFMQGYRNVVAGSAAWPGDDVQAGALIRLFSLEKACYEIRYEAENRPSWLGIPLRGVRDLLGVTNS